MKQLYRFLSVTVLGLVLALSAFAQGTITQTSAYSNRVPDEVYFLPGDTLVWQFTSAYDSAITLWNFADPEAPTELGTYGLPSSLPGKVIGNYYVTVNRDGVVTLYDASDLSAISELSSAELDLSFTTEKDPKFKVMVKNYGDYLYVAGIDGNPLLKGVHILDISDPNNMVFVTDINDKAGAGLQNCIR